MTIPLVMHFTIRHASFRRRLTNARKLASGEVHEVFEPVGYFVVLDPGGIAFRLGDEDMGIKPGQLVRLRLEFL